ncbi:MAG: hypothetical protein RAO92_01435 [Candidatus Euphemobacter frigidus]|nr:hypothetical protein [Candidatus Euphemobacter frigidus]MDP8275043.1 hypothetical protein [Candidatus Euphemobacter frigidus]
MTEQVDKLRQDELFADFLAPIEGYTEFRDATYFLREDGNFVFSQGYYHPVDPKTGERFLVSHIIFVPQRGEIPDYAKKRIFGQTYENITKVIMETQPPELFDKLQMEEYLKIDPTLAGPRPYWAKYLVFIPVSSFVGCFPTRHSLAAIFALGDGGDERASRIKRAIEVSADRLGIPPAHYGMSGSVSLGNYHDPHDLDVVIHGTIAEVRRVVNSLRELTARDEDRRVYEFGKFWPIRYWEKVDGRPVMFCPFFSLLDPDEFPLRDFTIEELGMAKLEGRVCDHTFNAFNPTLLRLDRVKIDGKTRDEDIHLVLYHGEERGDYLEGDLVEGRAMHTVIRTFRGKGPERKQADEFEAIVTGTMGEIKKVK